MRRLWDVEEGSHLVWREPDGSLTSAQATFRELELSEGYELVFRGPLAEAPPIPPDRVVVD